MGQYQSYHFSPLNNRSILMPRIPKGQEYKPEKRLENAFAPINEEALAGKNPYFQINTGCFLKEFAVGEETRKYCLYVPEGLSSKAPAAVLFPDSGISSDAFLKASNWKALADQYKVILIVLESGGWRKDQIDKEFDYAWAVIEEEFSKRLTVDICESYIYPIGLEAGAYVAAAFAATYSATFPAVAADGDLDIDPKLFETLERLPSDGIDTWGKKEIALPAFLIDRSGRGEATASYLKETIRAKEEGLSNAYGRVYLEQPRRGAYFVNEQPIAQVWIGEKEQIDQVSRETLNEEMLKFVLRYARWGGFGNNHLRAKRTLEETGAVRVYKEIDGLPRYWDVFIPSCYQPGEQKEYPLVVAIHGFSCNSEYFEQTSDWQRLAEERGFFVVFASAYPRNVGRSRFPLPGWCVWPMQEEGIDETSYFKILLDDMEEKYPIDKRRIYAVGHSNGGRMTQSLTRTMPERFAAFGPTGALGGNSADAIEPIHTQIPCPIAFMMGEYDLRSPSIEPGSTARATLEAYCRVNHVKPQYENWYDNGNYHTLVMYDENHVPMIRYTIMKGCPHTYTAEMAQMTWDQFLCHFTREADGSIQYHG